MPRPLCPSGRKCVFRTIAPDSRFGGWSGVAHRVEVAELGEKRRGERREFAADAALGGAGVGTASTAFTTESSSCYKYGSALTV